jgi:hypothetical protein
MWSFFKKLLSVLIVLYVVALILNLKVGGKPTRDWTMQAWNSPQVQKVYRTIKDRIMALVRKDISVEDVFKGDLPKGSTQTTNTPPAVPSSVQDLGKRPEEIKTINLENLDEKDREALKQILNKSGN